MLVVLYETDCLHQGLFPSHRELVIQKTRLYFSSRFVLTRCAQNNCFHSVWDCLLENYTLHVSCDCENVQRSNWHKRSHQQNCIILHIASQFPATILVHFLAAIMQYLWPLVRDVLCTITSQLDIQVVLYSILKLSSVRDLRVFEICCFLIELLFLSSSSFNTNFGTVFNIKFS